MLLRLLAAALAAGCALAVRALGAGTATGLAALGTGTLRGRGGRQSETSDEGEHGARFDQCFHMFLVCGVGVSEKESFPLHKVITRRAPDPPENLFINPAPAKN
jgi:hypothetical protein